MRRFTHTSHPAKALAAAGVLALAALALGARGDASAAGAGTAAPAAVTASATQPLATFVAALRGGAEPARGAYDGVVEAVRQTVVAAQVSGAVVQLAVKTGDRVSAGQLLVRIDARAAEFTTAAGDAQLRAARAAQDVAAQELERQQKLFGANFISAAALDRARAEFRSSQAMAAAQAAQAEAARTQGGFYAVRAPYSGIVSDVPVSLGDMATPGRPLLTLYDPAALRVSASVPQSAAARLGDGLAANARVELPALPAAQRQQTPRQVQLLPSADAATHTVTVRADLDTALPGLAPGQFARLWLPLTGKPDGLPVVPESAIVRRGELVGLYVLNAQGQPLLRQVRLGRADAGHVQVLAGLALGERVATDAEAATRLSTAGR